MRVSKIARLPAAIREELNQRLLDNERYDAILPWLNALPCRKKIPASSFEAAPITADNLSSWRQGGYQDWMSRRDRLVRLSELAGFAVKYSKVNNASIADGAAAIASGKLLELLELVDDTTAPAPAPAQGGDTGKAAADSPEKQELPVEQVVKIAMALRGLRATEQDEVRLEQNRKRIKQTDEKIALEREKFQRERVDFALEILRDARAKEIEADSAISYEQRIEILGQHIFGDIWTPRNIPGVVSLPAETTDAPALLPAGEETDGKKCGN